ncbi:uncharacterized protein LOC122527019 [Frieseomelitta varia]|uniref:uncharacterized protein LOC122527019 n=1 Tax=Frieseomelitta varia TaxID=561572 RepID=UPI001CB67B8A|nr:uncharacterized protein LOC122527019 [Frieseomelitta varia]
MNVCESIENISESSDEDFVQLVRRLEREENRATYTCDKCKYESNRQFNVQRHKQRIHSKAKLNICCGETFCTKGDYYVHCEQIHPATRSHAIISRTKYKIANNLVPIDDRNDLARECERRQGANPFYKMRSRSRNFRVKDQTKVSLQYSVNYIENVDIENIPLINFLTDHRLKSISKLLVKANKKPSSQDKKQTLNVASSSAQNIEKTTSANNNTTEENVRTEVVDSSSLSLELPTKKLILQRFRLNEFQTTFHKQSANIDRNEANLAEKMEEKATVPAKIKRVMDETNKENVFTFSMRQQLNIQLNTKFELPVTSHPSRVFETHRF